MEDQSKYPPPIEKLCCAGDPLGTLDWVQGDLDYVKQFELVPDHIPALIDIAREWLDIEERPEDDILYAPVHAWRALGQLRAFEAVEPLLAMQKAMDELSPDWYLEEFPYVFGWIGLPAIPALTTYLADQQNIEFPRVSATSGLKEIAKRYPDTRDQVVEILTRQLANHEPEAYSLNGFLVSRLLDLKAVESAEVIERAYAAEVVDETIVGRWKTVRKELGVKGLGLAPEKTGPLYEGLMPPLPFSDMFGLEQNDRDRQREREKKEKAKRKQQEKAKKRNRKKR
jgi:hypothetical protein